MLSLRAFLGSLLRATLVGVRAVGLVMTASVWLRLGVLLPVVEHPASTRTERINHAALPTPVSVSFSAARARPAYHIVRSCGPPASVPRATRRWRKSCAIRRGA